MSLAAMSPAVTRAVLRALMRLPRPLLSRLAGARGLARQGDQRLDEQIALALALDTRFGPPPIHHEDPQTARVIAARSLAPFDAPPQPMARVRDLDAGGVPVRVYTPEEARAGGPALLYYHGGGGVIGSIDSYDPTCRLLAHHTGFVVASVGYRLAPEHVFPAAVEDAMRAYQWARAHAATLDADPARIAVGGDSMGGNLAAVVCQQARREGAPLPALQVLLYPLLDATLSSPSHRTFARGYLLDRELTEWFHGHYLSDPAQVWDLRASPLHAVDLSGLPPAMVVTAGFDPLRDEARIYADRLQRAGVPVQYRCHGSLIHGFVTLTGVIDAARRAVAQITADIREALQ